MAKVIVCIWMPWENWALEKLGELGLGHAAIRLPVRESERYITWEAKGNPLQAAFKFQKSPILPDLDVFTFEQDKVFMKNWFNLTSPNNVIELPILSLSAGRVVFGVSARRMNDFWDTEINRKKKFYAFLSAKYNCAGCVCEALKAGGLGYYADSPESIFIQGAAELLTWVNNAKANLWRLNRLRHAVEFTMVELATMYTHDVTENTVPTIDEWKAESDKNVSFRAIAQRRGQVAALDKLILDYHAATKDEIKAVVLCMMQNEVHSHLASKRNSDRRSAVDKLGVRVTRALTSLPPGLDLESLTDQEYTSVMDLIGQRSQELAGIGI
jgi:hypothetical protein